MKAATVALVVALQTLLLVSFGNGRAFEGASRPRNQQSTHLLEKPL